MAEGIQFQSNQAAVPAHRSHRVLQGLEQSLSLAGWMAILLKPQDQILLARNQELGIREMQIRAFQPHHFFSEFDIIVHDQFNGARRVAVPEAVLHSQSPIDLA
jgi:hypothetical protein